jgi:hypothetical protein
VIAQAPTGATITASIANGDSLITLKHVISYKRIHRPATREEIEELPARPASTRKKLEQTGVDH